MFRLPHVTMRESLQHVFTGMDFFALWRYFVEIIMQRGSVPEKFQITKEQPGKTRWELFLLFPLR